MLSEKWTPEALAEFFTEDELYDLAIEQDDLERFYREEIMRLNETINKLKEVVKHTEEVRETLWKAKYIVACRDTERF